MPAPKPSLKAELSELGDLAIALGEIRREVKDWMDRQAPKAVFPWDAPGWEDQRRADRKFYAHLKIVSDALRAQKGAQP